jgi:glutaredoxin
MADKKLMVYGVSWCPDCRRTKNFLDDYGIVYTWFDIDEDPTAEAVVKEKIPGTAVSLPWYFPTAPSWLNPPMRSWPTN